MVKKPKAAERMLDDSLDLISKNGWRNTSLADMANAAGVPLGVFLGHYPSRSILLDAFAHRVDLALLNATDQIDDNENLSERLFEALMLRFDAMRDRKGAIRAIVHDILRQPLQVICRTPRLSRSMELTLETAGISCSGLTGLLRINGLVLVYLEVLRVWLNDDSEDMGKTMAALNRRLQQVDTLFKGPCSYLSSVKIGSNRLDGV